MYWLFVPSGNYSVNLSSTALVEVTPNLGDGQGQSFVTCCKTCFNGQLKQKFYSRIVSKLSYMCTFSNLE